MFGYTLGTLERWLPESALWMGYAGVEYGKKDWIGSKTATDRSYSDLHKNSMSEAPNDVAYLAEPLSGSHNVDRDLTPQSAQWFIEPGGGCSFVSSKKLYSF